MIRIQQVSKTFDQGLSFAVQGVDLEVGAGSCWSCWVNRAAEKRPCSR